MLRGGFFEDPAIRLTLEVECWRGGEGSLGMYAEARYSGLYFDEMTNTCFGTILDKKLGIIALLCKSA